MQNILFIRLTIQPNFLGAEFNASNCANDHDGILS
jgi:hypothetical protein